MIDLFEDFLNFRFPEVHQEAVLTVGFQRTLRIPVDGKTHPLPPGLGRFPVRLIDDVDAHTPEDWRRRGGVAIPMHQSEALWIYFPHLSPRVGPTYPFAVKVAAGKINALTGEQWAAGLELEPQNYLVTPRQPWLDGFAVGKGVIRQFIAMPLGAGYTAEEQLTDAAEYGGLQLEVFPMKAEVYERLPRVALLGGPLYLAAAPAMGLAPGGKMRQEIYEDEFGLDAWETEHSSRCFVHIENSMIWRSVTGEPPPQPPVTSAEYEKHGLPWFDYYDDSVSQLVGSDALAGLQSVREMGDKKGDVPLPENETVTQQRVVRLGPISKSGPVRECGLTGPGAEETVERRR